MADKNKGLYQKYYVKKLSNPDKVIDSVVLEFDDPIAHAGLWPWAVEMRECGYYEVYSDTIDKLNKYEVIGKDNEDLKYHKHKKRIDYLFKAKEENKRITGFLKCNYSHVRTVALDCVCTKCGWSEKEWSTL